MSSLLQRSPSIQNTDAGLKHSRRASTVRSTRKKELSHLEAAQAIVTQVGRDNVTYAMGTFWIWDESGVWRRADDREVRVMIHRLVRDEATKGVTDSILDAIKTESYTREWRTSENFLGVNCKNCELEFDGDKWISLPHRKEMHRISQIPISFDPYAHAPQFETFLDQIFAGSSDANDKKRIVLELIGYSLIQSCKLETFIILIGSGSNGKSVLLNCLEALCGQENVSAVCPQDFSNRFQRAYLHGKLANIVTEVAEGGEICDAELKAVVSGELLTAEMKFKPPMSFHPYCTCWIATNHLPHVRDYSDALFRRAKILTFPNKFDGVNRDPNLKEKLLSELPGILNLALEYFAEALKRSAFTECDSERMAKQDWRKDADQAAQFFEEQCIGSTEAKTPSKEVYKRYVEWAADSGIRKTLNKNNLTRRLMRLGVMPCKGSGGGRMLAGIQLKDPFTEPFL